MEKNTKLEFRCAKCSRLLAVRDLKSPAVEIKCNRCKHINFFLEEEPDQFIITDFNGFILYANKALSNLTGYSIEEMIGKRPSLWGNQMSETFYKNLWHDIKVKKKVINVVVKNKKKNGVCYKARLRISPILDEKGDPKFFVGVETVIK